MPEIFEPNVVDPWPAWATPAVRSNIAGWPKPNSVRIDGRFKWISDDLWRNIATRHYMTLYFGDLFRHNTQPSPITSPSTFEWFWYDLELKGVLHAAGSSGTSRTGKSCDIDIRYHEVLPLWFADYGDQRSGVEVKQTIRIPGDDPFVRITDYFDFPTAGPPTLSPDRFLFDRRYQTESEIGVWDWYRQPSDFFQDGTQTFPVKVADWYPTSECFPMSQFEP